MLLFCKTTLTTQRYRVEDAAKQTSQWAENIYFNYAKFGRMQPANLVLFFSECNLKRLALFSGRIVSPN